MEKEFIEVINNNQGIILKICRMYCHDPSDSEDLFQEILFQLWKSYPKFNRTSKVTTWMYKVGLNTAITSSRKSSKRRDVYPILDGHQNLKEQDTARIDVLYKKELQQAIAHLNKFDRALMVLYLDEKSYKEMSEIIGISESNVGVKINRIKKKLKEILNP